jgi:uncharacterized Tic20 family protein
MTPLNSTRVFANIRIYGGRFMTQSDVPPQPEPGPPSPSGLSKDERTWGMLAHLAALAGFTGIPFGNVLGPLVVWLIKKEEFPFVDDQGKESLNFQITVMIGVLICIPLCFLCIGIPMLIALGIANLVFIVLAMIKANEGVAYRYPFTLRLIK